MFVRLHACMCVCVWACIFLCYFAMFVCMHACMYVCRQVMCVCSVCNVCNKNKAMQCNVMLCHVLYVCIYICVCD